MAGSRSITVRQDHLAEIADRGLPVPTYDRARLQPRIAHVGVGGFHRAHLAVYVHELADAGGDWGIVGVGMLDHDAKMAELLAIQDHLYTLIERGADEPTAGVIGSIVGFVHAPPGHDDALAKLVAAPDTAILSLTVTEGGYATGPDRPPTFARLAAALEVRMDADAGPLTILSCDNLPGNGDAARRATLEAAAARGERLEAWVGEHCSFPNSMVDRITPVTSDDDRRWLLDAHGVDDGWPVVAEPFRQWVVEDDFAGGRPPWEDVGALFTDRIHDWELYKLRFLNAGHSCIAYLSALAGFTFVHEAVADPVIRAFLEDFLHCEAMPTLDEIPGHPKDAYIASVLERFANPGVRDQISRVCIDGSAKFPTFLVPTIERQLAVGGPIDRAAMALAGWARYLGTVAPEDQALDSDAETAREHAAAARSETMAFLEFDAVFTPTLRGSDRFRAAFSRAYRRVAADGPLRALQEPVRDST